MAQLLVDYITSLDGYGSAEGWPGLWGMGGPEYYAFLEEDAKEDHTLLMGANTYRLFWGFVSSGDEADAMEELTARRKIVFSRTMTEPPEWSNTTLVRDDAVEAVRALKESQQASLRTIGSPGLVRSLLKAGLVDRYRVVVFPVVNGATGDDRIYDGWPDVGFSDISTRTLDGRLQLFEAVPTVLSAPPGAGD